MIKQVAKPVYGVVTAFAMLFAFVAPDAGGQQNTIPPDVKGALDRISPDSMRGHLSFIASDLLEGRFTPSRGLDTAALYIAAQFRRAGLEPAGDDGYFQTANWMVAEPDVDAFELSLRNREVTIQVKPSQVSLPAEGTLQVDRAEVVKVAYGDDTSLAALTQPAIEGKAVLTEIPDFRRGPRERWGEMFRARNEFLSRLSSLKALVVLSIDRISAAGSRTRPGRLIDPEDRRQPRLAQGAQVITIHDSRVVRLFDELKAGTSPLELSLHLPARERPVKLRNVVGVLRGSDVLLKDTYVLVTAHYDHIGIGPEMEGDNIFNGANDDGSGTVSVIELASALAGMKQRPKRSIAFMTFFGEERGLLGSRYYGRHPVFPLENTVADINLEQVGRTDSTEGPQVANASLTGFDFSDVGTILKAAGELTGITVYKHWRNSDAYFSRSDNQALADQGVPAHTLCTAFEYPDYHGAGDHWEKIDYDNMARVDRMVALALVMMANNPQAPKWNETNPKTARYVTAWKQHHGGATLAAPK
jgi:hypothetical protein